MSVPSRLKRPGFRALLCFWFVAVAALASCRPAPLTIRAGLLLDGRGGQRQDAVITVSAGRIRSVGSYAGEAISLDLSRYTVLPGLIDAHVHISGYLNRLGRANTGDDGETAAQARAGRAASALATLRAGFTTVASMGHETDAELRTRTGSGRIPGPRILTSLTPISDTTLTPEALAKLVRRHKSDGADFIKIFGSGNPATGAAPTFTPEQLSAACGEARRIGLRAVVHALSDASMRMAAAAGCGEVEHGFLGGGEGLRELAARGVYFDPQCSLILDNYLDNRARFEGIKGFPPATFALAERLRPVLPELLRSALATPGLKLVYGTDAVAGAHGRNADDLVCRVRRAGQSPMEALVTATSRNAAALGLGLRVGTIAPGFEADLIGLEGNPLDEIEAVRRVKFVMKGGRVFFKP